MSIKYRYAKPIPGKLQKLEQPGGPFLFDADRGLVVEVSSRCNVKALVESLKGKTEAEAEAACDAFGRRLMETTIELADSKYMDRTGEVILKVARQTGITFPHCFERYVELSIIGSRPLDRWNIAEATTKRLKLQVFGCSVAKEMKEAGLSFSGLPCRALCLASFQVAAAKTGDSPRVEMTKALPQDNQCEFVFAVQG